jgi:hypothetical protein
MPLYACSKCQTVDNTALSRYWQTEMEAHKAGIKHEPLCSSCDPQIGKWHGRFPRERADSGGWEPNPKMPRYLQRIDPNAAYSGPRET